jgi:hypothetical protein
LALAPTVQTGGAWFAAPGSGTAGLFLPAIEPVDHGPEAKSLTSAARPASPAGDPSSPALDTGRGYYPYGLTATFFERRSFYSDIVATVLYTQPIDFDLNCTGEVLPYEGCKLYPSLPRGDDYGVRWEGELLAPADGVYTFWLSSTLDHRHPDDVARLYVDEELVANWWGVALRSPATMTLSAGRRDVRIEYGQWAKSTAALQVRWAGPGFEAEVIPVYGFPDDGPPCPNPQNEEGGPVNTKSGNYIYQVSDLYLQTLAGPLSFERTYSAQTVDTFSDDLLGYGWTHNHNRQLVFPDDPGGEANTVILRGENGSSQRFWQVAMGAGQYRYEPRPEVRAEMVMRAG